MLKLCFLSVQVGLSPSIGLGARCSCEWTVPWTEKPARRKLSSLAFCSNVDSHKGHKGHAIWKHPVSAAVQRARFQKALRERPKFDRNERRRNGDCKRFEHNQSIQCWIQSVLFFPRRYTPNSILAAAGNSPGLKFGAVGCPVGCRWLRRSSPALCSVLGFSYQGCPLGISFRRGSLEVCSWTVTWLQMDSHNIRT